MRRRKIPHFQAEDYWLLAGFVGLAVAVYIVFVA